MNVLLLHLVPPARLVPRGLPLGLATCAAVLRSRGHEVYAAYVERLRGRQISSLVRRARPGLIGVSVATDQFPLARDLVRWLSRGRSPPIVLGGAHPTMAPEEAIALEGILGICRGEGELALLELVERLERHEDFLDVRNFWLRSDRAIVRNTLRPLVEDLDGLPYPDRSAFDYGRVLKGSPDDGAEFMAGRGCPFDCAFCSTPALRRLYRGQGRFVRMRSVGHLLEEIRLVLHRHPAIRRVTFHDDIFCLDRAWLAEFSERYPRVTGTPFRCNLRADLVDRETIGLLSSAGCDQVWIGVECGNERLRNETLKKRLPDDAIEAAFRLCREGGMKTRSFNMIGLPGESPADIEATIALNERLRADSRSVTVFRPYPGTELHSRCAEQGWISDRRPRGYFDASILDQPTIEHRDTYFYQVLLFCAIRSQGLAQILRRLHGVSLPGGGTLFHVLFPRLLMHRLYRLLLRLGIRL